MAPKLINAPLLPNYRHLLHYNHAQDLMHPGRSGLISESSPAPLLYLDGKGVQQSRRLWCSFARLLMACVPLHLPRLAIKDLVSLACISAVKVTVSHSSGYLCVATHGDRGLNALRRLLAGHKSDPTHISDGYFLPGLHSDRFRRRLLTIIM